MSINRANLVGNVGTFLIVIDTLTHPYIYVQEAVFFRTTYQRDINLFGVGDFAHATDDRYQTCHMRTAQRYVYNPTAQQE